MIPFRPANICADKDINVMIRASQKYNIDFGLYDFIGLSEYPTIISCHCTNDALLAFRLLWTGEMFNDIPPYGSGRLVATIKNGTIEFNEKFIEPS